MGPHPAVGSGGDAEAETPKAPRRSSRRLGYTQCSQYCPPEPKVVWDCQSPDATALARPGKCVSPGELFDQPGSVVDKGDSSGNPETPPLVRIWLKERTVACAEGAKETSNLCKGRRTRLPLTSLGGPVKKLCRPSSDDHDAPPCASALDCIRNEPADWAADRELFVKLAAAVGVKQASNDGEPSTGSDESFTLPQPDELLNWSDQSSFDEMSFTTTPSVVTPVATAGDSLLAARSPLTCATTSAGRAGRSRLPNPLVVDAGSSAAGTPVTSWSSSGRSRPGKGTLKHQDPAPEGPSLRTVGSCAVVHGSTRMSATRSAVDLSSELMATLPCRASDVDAAGHGTSGDSKSSRGSLIQAPAAALTEDIPAALDGTRGAATRVPPATTAVSSSAAAVSHSVQVVACSGVRRSPRVAARAPVDHQLQPPAYCGLSAVAVESMAPAVPSCSGGVRRQLRLPVAGSLGSAGAATDSSSCTEPGARGAGAIVGLSEVVVATPQQTSSTAGGSAALPQQGALTAAGRATMQSAASTAATRAAPVAAAPAGRAQSRQISHQAELTSTTKVVNLWDMRHRSDVLLKKGGPDATVTDKGWQSATGGSNGTGAAPTVGGSSVCSQGSNSGSTVRCSSEEIARKRLEALERRRKAAGMQTHAVTQPIASATNTGAAYGSTGCSVVTVAPSATSTSEAIGRTGSTEAQAIASASVHTDAGSGNGSQPSSRCSSEEIARKRKEALERKMRKAAASATQSATTLSGGVSTAGGIPVKAACASAAAVATTAASMVKRTLLGR